MMIPPQIQVTLDQFRALINLAAQIDRENLELVIRLSDSDLAQELLKQKTTGEKVSIASGNAMMRLACFFLAELDLIANKGLAEIFGGKVPVEGKEPTPGTQIAT